MKWITDEKVINQKGGFVGSLMSVGLALMKTVLTPLAKNFLLPFEVTAAAAATKDYAGNLNKWKISW